MRVERLDGRQDVLGHLSCERPERLRADVRVHTRPARRVHAHVRERDVLAQVGSQVDVREDPELVFRLLTTDIHAGPEDRGGDRAADGCAVRGRGR